MGDRCQRHAAACLRCFVEAAGKPAAEIQGALLSDIFGSGQEMRPAELSNDLKRTESGLPPRRRELEVTESIFLDGGDHIQAMLKNLRTLGIRTVLDDFGTGYSSLSYLRRFPFDKRLSRSPTRSACRRRRRAWNLPASSPSCGTRATCSHRHVRRTKLSPCSSRGWKDTKMAALLPARGQAIHAPELPNAA